MYSETLSLTDFTAYAHLTSRLGLCDTYAELVRRSRNLDNV